MNTLRLSLDRLTGRITMYRLMIAVLGTIAAIAFVLSLIPGGIAYSPLALISSLATLLVASVLSSWVFAALFRTTPHLESSVISALLLFFLFFPAKSTASLLVLAVVAVIATASKYLLAIRGRHIFNPVAIASVIIALSGLSAAVWWVATPILLIPVIIGGFLIAYRTKRFALIGVFLVVVLIISTIRLTAFGTTPDAALWLTIGSGPAVFFAVFMLDEPLTLPPLRWQQLGVAALVGVFFSVPFTLGPLYTSPELALVVGNLVAFFFGQRRRIRLKFIGRRELTPTSAEFEFEPTGPVAFTPGQYMELTHPHRRPDARGSRRTFTVASAPGSNRVSFGLKIPASSSTFKHAIGELTPGTLLQATAVGGDFVLPRNPAVPLLLVAGGIGITPFISQLRHLVSVGEDRDIVLVYSVSDAKELAYLPELESARIPVLVTAPSAPEHLPNGWTYLGSGRLTAELLSDRVADLTGRTAMVSGPPGLVTALRRDLRALGIRRVKTDYFSGY